jgi:hypothetical protein
MSTETTGYDLWYDATSVGADLVVETWISHGPRASDTTFDPRPGDWLLVGDDEEPPCRARVIRRNGNRVPSVGDSPPWPSHQRRLQHVGGSALTPGRVASQASR